jgi:putative transposase
MMVNRGRGNRRSIRLKEYDYAQSGYYFVTVCVNDRRNLFGDIEDGKIALSDAGRMVQAAWNEIPEYYNGIDIDISQIMPNHFHGIIIVGAGPCACPNNDTLSLGDIVGRFKSLTTTRYIDGVKNNNWPPFNKHFWQRNYYEHVIRDDKDLADIREYIANNPARWQEDEYYIIGKGQPQGVAPTVGQVPVPARTNEISP